MMVLTLARMVIGNTRGREARTFVGRFFEHFVEDGVTDGAAQVSYYFLFALFPFLLFIVTVAAYLPLAVTLKHLLTRLSDVMPHEAYRLIQEHLDDLLGEKRHRVLTAGFVTAIWSASRGVDATRRALNRAYRVTESRPYWKTQLLAVMLTLASIVLFLLAFAALTLGGAVGEWLARHGQIGRDVHGLWSALRWPSTLLLLMAAAALIYYLLPDVRPRFRSILPGAIAGSVAWLVATWVFTQLVGHFGHFNATYGSIGGVIVLMLWLYIGGIVLIAGGEINSILGKQDRSP